MDGTPPPRAPQPLFKWGGGILLLGLGFWLGMLYQAPHPSIEVASAEEAEGEVRLDTGAYKFINPLLECDLGQQYLGQLKPKPSREKIERLIEDAKLRGDVTFASVYYRELNNGPWMGINERAEFTPASLLKLPLMLYYLKLAESDPAILQKEVPFSADIFVGGDQYFQSPQEKLEVGKSYAIQYLIERAIVYSDNQATALLLSITPQEPLQALFRTMHVEPPAADGGDFITVKDYATFFRVLFNASFINNERSEQALELLARSSFNKGLTAKLPPELVVAHKFGERTQIESSEGQLHDCGIVYYPNNPYLLCVMTRGHDMNRLTEVIATLSKEIYDQVNQQVAQP